MAERLTLEEILAGIRQHWPEAETPETSVVLGIIRLNDIIADVTRRVVSGFGLTQTGFEVLMTLRAQPEPRRLTPTELYRAVLVTSGGMTKVLKQLEQEGSILREDNLQDQRSRFVCLTEAGSARAEEVMAAVAVQDKSILHLSLSPEQINHLGETLLQTIRQLEAGDARKD